VQPILLLSFFFWNLIIRQSFKQTRHSAQCELNFLAADNAATVHTLSFIFYEEKQKALAL
jgi:cytochrome c oxidase assembly factor CtaG